MLTEQQQAALRAIASAAVAAERATGCPAELSAAQAALESAWLSVPSGKNNCFGIKSNPGISGRELVTTHEWFTPAELAHFLSRGDGRTAVLDPPQQSGGTRQRYRVQDWFAAFETPDECFAYHAGLLQRGVYAPAWERYQADHDLDRYIAVVAGHYATAPDYAHQVSQVANGLAVSTAVLQARQGEGGTDGDRIS
jgi:flagellum-specific peptidoglycan hydrolase FlgJ